MSRDSSKPEYERKLIQDILFSLELATSYDDKILEDVNREGSNLLIVTNNLYRKSTFAPRGEPYNHLVLKPSSEVNEYKHLMWLLFKQLAFGNITAIAPSNSTLCERVESGLTILGNQEGLGYEKRHSHLSEPYNCILALKR